MQKSLRIAVVGAGLGGATAAILLHQSGFDVRLYEQASTLSRIGAGIHLGPNLMKVMRQVGIEDLLKSMGSRPDYWHSRDGKTGEIIAKIPLGDYAWSHYGANYLTVHRGDFHALLANAVPPGVLRLNKRLTSVVDQGDVVHLSFADGSMEEADIVIGADGVYSHVRATLLGAEPLKASGYVGHRTMIPLSSIKGFTHDLCTKWWADDRHMMVYFLDGKRDAIYLVTGVPEGEQWDINTPWVPSSRDELRAAFEGWHPGAQSLIDGAENVTKWPFFERDPLPLWSRGRIVLLGDACHPMKPHMAQGAAMAIEDAAMLTRCFQSVGLSDYPTAFALFQANRQERTRKVAFVSHNNDWLRTNEDPAWCFGYDVFTTPLVEPARTAAA
jgi:6-hydroxynicotinate 3-monooxygenase